MYKYYNCNPQNRQVNDCVVRAISTAQHKDWDEVYTDLSILAQQQCTILDDVGFVEKYLNRLYPSVYYRCDGRRLSIKQFITTHSLGTYLLTMKGHITCIIDGTIYDTWDCGNSIIWGAWEVY